MEESVLFPLSPCGSRDERSSLLGWLREAKTGEGSVSADGDPSSGALRAPPAPPRGEGQTCPHLPSIAAVIQRAMSGEARYSNAARRTSATSPLPCATATI